MKLFVSKVVVLGSAASSMLFATPTKTLAAADLMLYPTRVVLTDTQRAAQVDIVNTSQIQSTYKVTLVRKRMTETGEFQDVTTPEPEERFSDDLIKYSPRQVTLVPGAGQTIRMMLKLPQNLAEGEYRSHLVLSKASAAISELPGKELPDQNTISMKVTANIGVSIPVIVRHGHLSATVTIDPAAVSLSTTALHKQLLGLKLVRTGSRSVYGDLVVYREKEKIAEATGLAIYTPNSQRQVKLNLLESSSLQRGNAIRIVFTEKGEKKPMAETTVVIP